MTTIKWEINTKLNQFLYHLQLQSHRVLHHHNHLPARMIKNLKIQEEASLKIREMSTVAVETRKNKRGLILLKTKRESIHPES